MNISIKSKSLVLIMLISFSILYFVVTLYNLQVIEQTRYDDIATTQATTSSRIMAPRGEIYDRTGKALLASNITTFNIEIVPAEIPKERKLEVFENLSIILDIPLDKISKKIPKNRYNSFQAIEIKNGVSQDKIYSIAERSDDFPGVSWRDVSIRSYNNLNSLSHIIGYVDNINKDELQVLYNKGYSKHSVIGKMGVEKQYDKLLKGTDGRYFQTVDVRGKKIRDKNKYYEAPTKGNNLILTIDQDIQQLCELALGEKTGAIVVLKPDSGEILSMVSYPWYDSNDFNKTNRNEKLRSYFTDDSRPLLNRAIQSNYGPASTFKMIMNTAILEENAFPIDKTITCEGKLKIGNRIFKCHKLDGHGEVNLSKALQESCDVYYYTVGYKYLKSDQIIKYSEYFGLGSKSGIDLPGEVSGLLPTPDWKKNRVGSNWVGGDTINMSIGQGYILTTPLQVANYTAMIAADGIMYKPHILKEASNGSEVTEFKKEIIKDYSQKISKKTFEILKKDMRLVITQGSGKNVITTNAAKIAGKTGTGQVTGYDENWLNWLTAYGPIDAPLEEQIVVTVLIEPQEEWLWWSPFAMNVIFNGVYKDLDFYESVKDLKWQWAFKDIDWSKH